MIDSSNIFPVSPTRTRRKPLDPWQVKEDDFPASGTKTEKLKFLLNYAVLAPSGHNTQPWFFTIRDDVIELYADRTRILPVVDPHQRELIISCGAALFYLRLAMLHFGYEDVVEYFKIFPDSINPYLLARISLGGRLNSTAEHHFLFRAIQNRHTSRVPFTPGEMPLSLILELEAAASAEYCWLEVIPEQLRQAVINLIVKGDRLQMADPLFRRELAQWVRGGHSPSHDGMPAYSQGINPHLDAITPLVAFTIGSFDLGEFQSHKDRHLAQTAPILAVLSTDGDTPQNWLAAGQALARVLLQANGNGVQASFLNQPIEIRDLRLQLQKILNTESCPQILLRMGYGKDGKSTPRRSVDEVVQESSEFVETFHKTSVQEFRASNQLSN